MSGLCQKILDIRLRSQNRCVSVFACLNITMVLFGIIWVISGLVFVSLDIHEHYRDWLASVHAGITAFVIFFFLFVLLIGIFGYKLTKQSAPTKCRLVLYAMFVLLLVFIPFSTYSMGLIVF
jgi:hypothetical protein